MVKKSTPRLSKNFINKECLKEGSSNEPSPLSNVKNETTKQPALSKRVPSKGKEESKAKGRDSSSDEYSEDEDQKEGQLNVVSESIQRALVVTGDPTRETAKTNKYLKLESELEKLKQKEKDFRRSIGKQYLSTSKSKMLGKSTSSLGTVSADKSVKNKFLEKKESTKQWEKKLRELNWKPLPPVPKEPEPLKPINPVNLVKNVRVPIPVYDDETKDPFFKKIFGLELEEQYEYQPTSSSQRFKSDNYGSSSVKVTSDDEASEGESKTFSAATSPRPPVQPDSKQQQDPNAHPVIDHTPSFLPNFHDNDFEDEMFYHNSRIPSFHRYGEEEEDPRFIDPNQQEVEPAKGLSSADDGDIVQAESPPPASSEITKIKLDDKERETTSEGAVPRLQEPTSFNYVPSTESKASENRIEQPRAQPYSKITMNPEVNDLIEIPMIRLSLSERLAPLLASRDHSLASIDPSPRETTVPVHPQNDVPRTSLPDPRKSETMKKKLSVQLADPANDFPSKNEKNPFKLPADNSLRSTSLIYQKPPQMNKLHEGALFENLNSYRTAPVSESTRYSNVYSSIEAGDSDSDENSVDENEFSAVNTIYKTILRRQQLEKEEQEKLARSAVESQAQQSSNQTTQRQMDELAVQNELMSSLPQPPSIQSSYLPVENSLPPFAPMTSDSRPSQNNFPQTLPQSSTYSNDPSFFQDELDEEEIPVLAKMTSSRPSVPSSSSNAALKLKMEMMNELAKQDQIFQYALELQDLERQQQEATHELPLLVAAKQQFQQSQQQPLRSKERSVSESSHHQPPVHSKKKNPTPLDESNDLLRSAEKTMKQSEKLLDLYIKFQKERQKQQTDTKNENVLSLANTLDNIRTISHLEKQLNQLPSPLPTTVPVQKHTAPSPQPSPPRRVLSAVKNTETQTSSEMERVVVIPTVPKLKTVEIQTAASLPPVVTVPSKSQVSPAYVLTSADADERQYKSKVFEVNQRHKERMIWLDQMIELHLSTNDEIQFERRKFESLYQMELNALRSEKYSATLQNSTPSQQSHFPSMIQQPQQRTESFPPRISSLEDVEVYSSSIAGIADKIWSQPQPAELDEQDFEEEKQSGFHSPELPPKASQDEVISVAESENSQNPMLLVSPTDDLKSSFQEGKESESDEEPADDVSHGDDSDRSPYQSYSFDEATTSRALPAPVPDNDRKEMSMPEDSYRYDEFEGASFSQTAQQQQKRPSIASETYSEDIPEEENNEESDDIHSESDRYQWTESKLDYESTQQLLPPRKDSRRYPNLDDSAEEIEEAEEIDEEKYSSYSDDIRDSFKDESRRLQSTDSKLSDDFPEYEQSEGLKSGKNYENDDDFEIEEDIPDVPAEEKEISDEEEEYLDDYHGVSQSKYSSVEDTKAIDSLYRDDDFEVTSASGLVKGRKGEEDEEEEIEESKALAHQKDISESLYIQDDFEIEGNDEDSESKSLPHARSLAPPLDESQSTKDVNSLEYSNDPHAYSSFQASESKKPHSSVAYSSEDFEIEGSDESKEKELPQPKKSIQEEEVSEDFEIEEDIPEEEEADEEDDDKYLADHDLSEYQYEDSQKLQSTSNYYRETFEKDSIAQDGHLSVKPEEETYADEFYSTSHQVEEPKRLVQPPAQKTEEYDDEIEEIGEEPEEFEDDHRDPAESRQHDENYYDDTFHQSESLANAYAGAPLAPASDESLDKSIPVMDSTRFNESETNEYSEFPASTTLVDVTTDKAQPAPEKPIEDEIEEDIEEDFVQEEEEENDEHEDSSKRFLQEESQENYQQDDFESASRLLLQSKDVLPEQPLGKDKAEEESYGQSGFYQPSADDIVVRSADKHEDDGVLLQGDDDHYSDDQNEFTATADNLRVEEVKQLKEDDFEIEEDIEEELDEQSDSFDHDDEGRDEESKAKTQSQLADQSESNRQEIDLGESALSPQAASSTNLADSIAQPIAPKEAEPAAQLADEEAENDSAAYEDEFDEPDAEDEEVEEIADEISEALSEGGSEHSRDVPLTEQSQKAIDEPEQSTAVDLKEPEEETYEEEEFEDDEPAKTIPAEEEKIQPAPLEDHGQDEPEKEPIEEIEEEIPEEAEDEEEGVLPEKVSPLAHDEEEEGFDLSAAVVDTPKVQTQLSPGSDAIGGFDTVDSSPNREIQPTTTTSSSAAFFPEGNEEDDLNDIVDLNPNLHLQTKKKVNSLLYDRTQNNSMYYDYDQQKWVGENEEPLAGFEDSDESTFSHDDQSDHSFERKRSQTQGTPINETTRPLVPIDLTKSSPSENSIEFSTETLTGPISEQNIEFSPYLVAIEEDVRTQQIISPPPAVEEKSEESTEQQQQLQLKEKAADEISAQLFDQLLEDSLRDIKRVFFSSPQPVPPVAVAAAPPLEIEESLDYSTDTVQQLLNDSTIEYAPLLVPPEESQPLVKTSPLPISDEKDSKDSKDLPEPAIPAEAKEPDQAIADAKGDLESYTNESYEDEDLELAVDIADPVSLPLPASQRSNPLPSQLMTALDDWTIEGAANRKQSSQPVSVLLFCHLPAAHRSSLPFPRQIGKDSKPLANIHDDEKKDLSTVYRDRLDEVYQEFLQTNADRPSPASLLQLKNPLLAQLLARQPEEHLKNYFYLQLLQEQEVATNRLSASLPQTKPGTAPLISLDASLNELLNPAAPKSNTTGTVFSMKAQKEWDFYDHQITAVINQQTEHDLADYANSISDHLLIKLLIESIESVQETLPPSSD